MPQTYFSRGSEPEIRRLELSMASDRQTGDAHEASRVDFDEHVLPAAEADTVLDTLPGNLMPVWLAKQPPAGARWSPSRRRFVAPGVPVEREGA